MKIEKILLIIVLLVVFVFCLRMISSNEKMTNPYETTSPFIRCKLESSSEIEKAEHLEKNYKEFVKDLSFLVENVPFKGNEEMYKVIVFKVFDNKNYTDEVKNKLIKIISQLE